ncbi:MAG: alpha-L-fucosidase [Bacteroidales bacterium]|nr:alpha-L-fucosidase [Bacteroidales bacterium]
MNIRTLIATALISLILCGCNTSAHLQHKPDAKTLTALNTWKNDHFGMFIHFGIYSKLAGYWQGEKIPFYGEQIMNHARIPVPEYEAVAREFNPIDFNADEIVSLAKEAGMKYIVITTKHHDGFCLFKTKTTNYNIVDFTPYGKDIVAQLAEACKKQGMKLGFYYSLPDWHFPQGIARMSPDTTTKCWDHVNQVYSPLERVTPELEDYIVAQVTELLSNYGEITTIWFDMGLITPEQSKRFRQTVKKLQPNCLINGRIMNNMGDYMTLPDNGNVASYGDVFWDNPASLYGTWGYKEWIERPDSDKKIQAQLNRLCRTVSHGGVFLLNIGPDGNGNVIPYEKEVLQGIGTFLRNHPDTLDILARQAQQPTPTPIIAASQGDYELTTNNGLFHAALDGTGYMSVVEHSWISWEIESAEEGLYDVFIIYSPENNDKEYILSCNKQELKQVLPGVDRMVQTSSMGSIKLMKGHNQIRLDQAKRATPLEPLGLELHKIILRKR